MKKTFIGSAYINVFDYFNKKNNENDFIVYGKTYDEFDEPPKPRWIPLDYRIFFNRGSLCGESFDKFLIFCL